MRIFRKRNPGCGFCKNFFIATREDVMAGLFFYKCTCNLHGGLVPDFDANRDRRCKDFKPKEEK